MFMNRNLMINKSINTKYGYYKIQNTQTVLYHENKFKAAELAQQINGWIEWVFHDEVFLAYDWNKEPNASITELYAQRAHQLREKYDHLILMYSGGYDSHNILQTFINNNIHLDEVCSFYSEYDYIVNSDINLEWRLQTKPRLECLLKLENNTRIRRLNIGPAVLDVLDNISEDYFYTNNNFALHYRAWDNIYNYVDDWSKLIDQGKKVALIFGVDKPRMRYHNHQWIYNFYDIGLLPRVYNDVMPVEWFYWTPDFPLIPIKQAHIVKNFWEPKRDTLSKYNNVQNKDLGYVLDFRNDDVQRLVYPSCGQGLFLTNPPDRHGMFGIRDLWVYQSNSEKKQIFDQLCQYAKDKFGPKYFNNGTFNNGFILNISPDYIVG